MPPPGLMAMPASGGSTSTETLMKAASSKPADHPQVHVGPNESRPGLVHLAIGTGTDGYDITPERAQSLGGELIRAAAAARAAAGKARATANGAGVRR